jgi:uncharacterized phage protein (TIGR02218 family)
VKAAPGGLTAELYAQTAHRPADLVQIELAAGTLRLTSADMAITFGGVTWTPGPIIDEIPTRSTLSLEADSTTVRIVPGDLQVAGVGLLARAIRGDFRGVRLLVQRAFVTTTGAIAGLDTMFDGEVEEVEPTSVDLRLHAKSATARLATGVMPARTIQPSCPFQIYSPQCGAAELSTTTTVAAGSTTDTIALTSTTHAAVSGWLEFLSGALAGQRATIVEVLSGGRVRVAVSLGAAPVAGDSVKIIRGCDKTRTTCSGTFANLPNFGGYPDVPQKDAA